MRQVEKLIYKSRNAHLRQKYRKEKLINLIIRILFACDISGSVEVGKNVQFVHNGLGVVVHPATVIKDDCMIYQNVTLGGNSKIVDGNIINKGAPILEDGVIVYTGACVLGPIRIGKNSIIGANSVVTKNVPENSLVVGNPMIIKEIKKNQ